MLYQIIENKIDRFRKGIRPSIIMDQFYSYDFKVYLLS